MGRFSCPGKVRGIRTVRSPRPGGALRAEPKAKPMSVSRQRNAGIPPPPPDNSEPPAMEVFSCLGKVRGIRTVSVSVQWTLTGASALASASYKRGALWAERSEAHERCRKATRESLLLRQITARPPAMGVFSCLGKVRGIPSMLRELKPLCGNPVKDAACP